MSKKTPEQKKARDLQRRTGWSYSECLRCVRMKSDDEIAALIQERFKVHADLQKNVDAEVAKLGLSEEYCKGSS